MAASYNLRTKHKQPFVAVQKQLSAREESPEIVSPRIQQKKQLHLHSDRKTPCKKNSSASATTGSTAELFVTPATNNDISTPDPYSNSLLESAIIIKKQLGSSLDFVKHESENEGDSYKKSYKRFNFPKPQGIPFRKCQTVYEEKAVSIINKIKDDKWCEKDLQRLFNKIENIPIKEIKNKFFVSAIKKIINLVCQPQNCSKLDQKIIDKMKNSFEALQTKLLNELNFIGDFQIHETPKKMTADKNKVIRRVFNIMRKKSRHQSRKAVQNKAILLVNQHYSPQNAGVNQIFKILGTI